MGASQNEYYPFQQFEADVEKIAKAIEASGRKFTKIWAPPRGGLPLAVCLSHRLNLELTLKSPFELLPANLSTPLLDTSDLWYKKVREIAESVLVVDDIADEGKALGDYKKQGFFIATLYYKRHCSFVPDIWLHEKKEAYIDFWWEKIGARREKETIAPTLCQHPEL